ncbi:MAG: 30S ribosomal protein S19e, partial [Candidatus Thorarchaeota archaeon]
PSNILIKKIASEFKEAQTITQPPEFEFVKTSHAKESSPTDPNWFYIRAGSLMRKLYFRDTIGVQNLRKLYSSPKNRGSKPEKSVEASGKIIRNILQQLEKAELVVKTNKGRKLSPKGISFIDKIAEELKTSIPEINQY